MSKIKKKNKKLGKAGRITLACFLGLLLALGVLIGCGAVSANMLHVRRAEVVLPDLPQAFDGVTLLYASDIDLCGLNSPEKSGHLFDQLQSLHPDVLLLGGDYTSPTVFDILNTPAKSADFTQRQLRDRASFFHYISAFEAPLGKYAIASPEDPELAELSALMTECGVTPLFNDKRAIRTNGSEIWLAGVCNESAGLNAAGRSFTREDCVVVLSYSPTVLPVLLTSEASDGGAWADLSLNGHTHGGQIRLFGQNALSLNRVEKQYLYGWRMDNRLPILTTSGVGCEGANLRLGSASEVWLITLRANFE